MSSPPPQKCKQLSYMGLEDAGMGCHHNAMKFTGVYEPAEEGGYTCFVEEIPAAISQGETLEEAKANLREALKLVLECRDIAR